jgi:serine/threonine protein kinase
LFDNTVSMAQATHQNALPIGSMLMEYRLDAVLGAGGFGITYLAFDTNLEKKVAIKEYLPSAVAVRNGTTVLPTSAQHEHDYRWGLDRFIQESRTLARFTHPHIVRVNRFFEANGTGYMVMDYEDGEPLSAYLRRNPFPSESALRTLMAPLLDGLEKVHAAGFLHRDIKPDNIFVRKDGGAVLIDFGSARQAAGGSVQALTTIVSPGYAPFEQYTTSAEQGPWSDIYSLAGVLYFAVTGQSPPDAITRMKSDTLAQGLGAARVRYGAPLIDAIAWGSALEDANRPRTIGEWRHALFGQTNAPAPAASPKPTAAPQAARPPSLAAGTPTARAPQTDVQRAAAIAAAMADMRREPRREASPWRWVFMAALALSAAIIASKLLSNRHPKTVIQTQPVVLVAPRPLNAPPPIKFQEAAALPSTAQSVPTAGATNPDAPAPAAVEPRANDSAIAPADTGTSSAPSQSAEPATQNASHMTHRVEQRIESKMHAADPEGLGLTREQFAQSFPRLSEHFDQIDTNHDGRITPEELMLGWQRFWAKSVQDAQ